MDTHFVINKAITKTDFANLRWKRYDNYHFAALDAVVPLVVQELPKACMALPIAFIGLAIDRNGDATVDELIQLVGLTATGDVVAADIIA